MKSLNKLVTLFGLSFALISAGTSRAAPDPSRVNNETALRDALTPDKTFPRVTIFGDITLTQAVLTVPRGVSLEFENNAKLRKGGENVEIFLDGSVPERETNCHFFAAGSHEWNPGDIRGLIGGMARRAEWWGAEATAELQPAQRAAQDDSRAINCAVGAVVTTAPRPFFNDGGHTLLLRSGFYYISSPIWLTRSRCMLRGVPSATTNPPDYPTKIRAYRNDSMPAGWRWIDAQNQSPYTWMRLHYFFPPVANPPPPADPNPLNVADWGQVDEYHVSMVYMGGVIENTHLNPVPFQIKDRTFSTFACAVHDLDLAAMPEQELGLRMSIITDYARTSMATTETKIEENSVIENIKGTNFSGFGVGFSYWAEINGLTVRNFELGPVDPTLTETAHPLYLPWHCGTCIVKDGIVKGGHRSRSSGLATPACHNKFDIMGICAQGLPWIRDVIVEDCHVAAEIIKSDGRSSLSLDNIFYRNSVADPSNLTSFAPFSAVVRIRDLYSIFQPCGQTALVLTNIRSGVLFPQDTSIMPLLWESNWGPAAINEVRKTSPTTQLDFFARKDLWTGINEGRVLGPDVSNPTTTEQQLRDAVAVNAPSIDIMQDITITQPLTVSSATTLNFAPGARLRKGTATADVLLDGPLPDRPVQIFAPGTGNPPQQWEPGEIRGQMGGKDRLAEWWGAVAGDPLNGDDTRGINCAVGAVTGVLGLAHNVQLGSGTYCISCPVIMTNALCNLRGRSSFGTALMAIPNTPQTPVGWRWIDHKSKFTRMTTITLPPGTTTPPGLTGFVDDSNHVAMIYVGGASFNGPNLHFQLNRPSLDPVVANSGVFDIAFMPLPESPPAGPTGAPPGPSMPDSARISFISALHDAGTYSSSVGQGTIIQNINGGQYTAYGVGFCQNTTVYGMDLHGFFLESFAATATVAGHPVFLPQNSLNCKIENGTFSGGFHVSAAGKPDIIGILVQGSGIKVNNVHAESCHVGVDIIATASSSFPTGVAVNNLDYFHTQTSNFAPNAAIVRIRNASNETATPSFVNATLTQIIALIQSAGLPLLFEPGANFTGTGDPQRVPTLLSGVPFLSLTFYDKHVGLPRVGPLF